MRGLSGSGGAASTDPPRGGPPWTAPGTVSFWRGPLSNFAPTPGLRLPVGYHGHHENDRSGGFGRALVPSDFVWGCRDPGGGYGGQNLFGLALMRVRDEPVADVRARLAALAAGRDG